VRGGCAPYILSKVRYILQVRCAARRTLHSNYKLQIMIHLSKTAAIEVTRLKSKYPNPNALFRLGVESSGCSGLSYTMAFDDAPAPEDAVCESEGISVAIDPQHLKYLNELTLDYSEDLMGGGFRFHNPNAAQSCSCGNSFSAKE